MNRFEKVGIKVNPRLYLPLGKVLRFYFDRARQVGDLRNKNCPSDSSEYFPDILKVISEWNYRDLLKVGH